MNDFNDSKKKDMMKPNETSALPVGPIDNKRRNFLLAAGCAPAIGVAVMLNRESVAEPVVAAAAPVEPTVSGYHETDHIRKYYRIAGHF